MNSLQPTDLKPVIPVVTYSFYTINQKLSDIKSLNSKRSKLLTKEKKHHPKADFERLYPPRSEGERGLVPLELTTIGLDTYLKSPEDSLIQLANHHKDNKKRFSIKKQAAKFKHELNLPEIPPT